MDYKVDSARQLLGTAGPKDAVLSPDGKTLYIAKGNKIEVYSVEERTLLTTYTAGKVLGGLSISDDGKYLVAADLATVSTSGSSHLLTDVHRFNTKTGSAETFRFDATNAFLDSAFYDTATLGNGMILLTQQFAGSGWITMKLLDPATGSFTAVPGSYRQDSVLSVAGDGKTVLIAESNISNAPLTLLRIGDDGAVTKIAGSTASGFNRGIQALSDDGGMIANFVGGSGLYIYNGNLQQVKYIDVAYHYITGLAFDADRSHLFLLDTSQKAVIKLSTTTWLEVDRIALAPGAGDDWSNSAGRFGNNLQLSEDGSYLIVIHSNGVERLDAYGRDGDANANLLTGNNNKNNLYGLAGNDTLIGLGGNDLLNGGVGADRMEGGTGDDYYIVDNAGDVVVETGDAGHDAVRTRINSYTLTDHVEDLFYDGNDGATLNGNSGVNLIQGGARKDIIDGRGGADTLNGGRGDDRIIVGTGADGTIVDGGAEVDTLVVTGTVRIGKISNIEKVELQGGANLMLSGAQWTSSFGSGGATFAGNGVVTISLAPGETFADTVTPIQVGAGVSFRINGTAGADTINGVLNAANNIHGGAGADVIRGGDLADTINGASGDDAILGGGGDDIILGGLGDDKIYAGAGADILSGGAGADVFRYMAATESGVGALADHITDFAVGVDKFQFRSIDTDSATPGKQGFDFIADNLFHATGRAEIRYQSIGADLRVEVDLDGDGAADMHIVLDGLGGQSLGVGDFIL
ncbi:MAG: hypothetical protein ACREB7_07000 [Sphingopyxis sp.]|uniref:hypothetical protein n=1 Tax=Sphingopyxis sp. TaxID=1908224 RepID=UPI003D6D7583